MHYRGRIQKFSIALLNNFNEQYAIINIIILLSKELQTVTNIASTFFTCTTIIVNMLGSISCTASYFLK